MESCANNSNCHYWVLFSVHSESCFMAPTEPSLHNSYLIENRIDISAQRDGSTRNPRSNYSRINEA